MSEPREVAASFNGHGALVVTDERGSYAIPTWHFEEVRRALVEKAGGVEVTVVNGQVYAKPKRPTHLLLPLEAPE